MTESFTALAWRRSIPEPNSGCWLWLGAAKKGYPFLWRGSRGQKRTIFVARKVCEERHGPIGRLFATHTCDVPLCVNPDHLIPGTNHDNIADKVKRGRASSLPGESNPNSKLTLAQVNTIRAAPFTRETARWWADKCGVHPHTVRAIHNGRGWL